MELAYDTVAQAVADEATAFIKRKNKRKLKRGGDRRSAKWHVTTFAWNQVKMCEKTDPGMINASLAMSIATHVALMPVKKSFSDYDWELSKQQTGTWILLLGKKSDQDVVMALADGTGKVKMLDIDKQWKLLPSQGNGLFFATDDDQLQFDQFVDVEDAPDLDLVP